MSTTPTTEDVLKALQAQPGGDACERAADGDAWRAECPACGAGLIDQPRRLTVTRNGKGPHLACDAGCEPQAILAALGLAAAPAEPAAPVLIFLTPGELRSQTPVDPPWLWDGYLAGGGVTLLVGKPKAGKSTLAIAVATAMATGAVAFLDRAVTPGAVVYVSEEGGATLVHKLPDDDAELHLLTRDSAWPKPDWVALIGAVVTHARKVDARLVVIDTAAFWTALPAESEKDAGAVQRAMAPLVQATRSGLAVLLVHHARKAGGEDGDAVRGSSGWAASVDTIIELERAGENAAPTQRLLLGLGRYPSTPPCTLVDHDPATGSWAVDGHAEDRRSARGAAARGVVLRALDGDASLTRSDLENATGTAWRELLDSLNALIADKLVVRTGQGVRGNPYRYEKTVGKAVPQNPTVSTESPRGGAAVSVGCSTDTPETATPPPTAKAVEDEPYRNGSHGNAEAAAVEQLVAAFDVTSVTS